MDRASLRSVEGHPGTPAYFDQLSDTAAGLLVEFQSANVAQQSEFEARAAVVLNDLDLLRPAEFTGDAIEQAKLWKIRKGMFPSVGAVRASGTTALMEDIALPVDRLAEAAMDLRALFDKHGYDNAIIFGHAKDGNLHFVLTQGFNTEPEIAQYRDFMDDVVAMVVGKYDGALKAEHGTGRNMAPFVETEWGPEAYRIMCELKAITDPHNLLNPGVIVNPDPEAHVSNLKLMPVVEPEIDKCIECGFCEHSCPSRDITLTPRQRIVVRREMQRLQDSDAPTSERNALDRDFLTMALDTCAADGLCATDCPVAIDTGKLTKRFRAIRHSQSANRMAQTIARHFAFAEFGARLALRAGHIVEKIFGTYSITATSRHLAQIANKFSGEPLAQWISPMPRPRRGSLPTTSQQGADAIYYPSCITRIMGALPGESEETSNAEALLNIASRAGIRLHIPSDVSGHCCGVPFSSKGFEAANHTAVNRIAESLFRWSDSGRLPVVIDTSPCTYGLKTCRPQLNPREPAEVRQTSNSDSVEYVQSAILPKLPIIRKLSSVALHPVCSATKMGIAPKLVAIAKTCSDEVIVPMEAGCCAFAGDRGFLYPELTASATKSEAAELANSKHDGYFHRAALAKSA